MGSKISNNFYSPSHSKAQRLLHVGLFRDSVCFRDKYHKYLMFIQTFSGEIEKPRKATDSFVIIYPENNLSVGIFKEIHCRSYNLRT